MIAAGASRLDVATPIATPIGWRTVGDLARGDLLFSAGGLPCRVVDVEDQALTETEVHELRLCDGTQLACGADQAWLVESDGVMQLRSAEDLAAEARAGGPPRFSVALPAPLEHRYAELAVEPYEQGARLGTGLLEEANGIPRSYLQADVLQRRELLMGLLDEGGGVSGGGAVHFDTFHRRLALDVCELVRSLGYRATASIGGGPRRSYRRIGFRPDKQVFGLRALAEEWGARGAFTAPCCRWVVDVSEVGYRATRSIVVDAESHLFVAGDGLLITPDAALAASVGCDSQLQITAAYEVPA